MAKRVTSYAALLANQKQRFDDLKLTQQQAVRDIALETYRDLRDSVSGTLTPKQTKGAFARGPAPNKRGSFKAGSLGTRRRPRGKRGVKKLPINKQSGRLESSAILADIVKTPGKTSFKVGFSSKAGGSIFTVLPGGTKKMVDRGLYGTNGFIAKRVAARRKAYRDKYIRKARTA